MLQKLSNKATWRRAAARLYFTWMEQTLKYTQQKYIWHVCLCFHCPWVEVKGVRVPICTQQAYFSQFWFTNELKFVLESTSPLLKQPDTWEISRCWLKSMAVKEFCQMCSLSYWKHLIRHLSKASHRAFLGGGEPVSIWYDQHLAHAVWYLLHIELIMLLIDGILVHSCSVAMWSCWTLAGIGAHCCTRRFKASQMCSTGDISGD